MPEYCIFIYGEENLKKKYGDKAGIYTSCQRLCNLNTGNIGEGIFMMEWDGRDPGKKRPYKGTFKIRWTINGGYREFPLVID